MTQKLMISPTEAEYTAQPGSGVVATKLDGGASRYRADQLGAAALVTVGWTLSAWQYQYLMAFFRSATERGSEPFLIDLIMDNAAMQEYTAHFVPESFALTGRAGEAYLVGAQLEVIPLDEDEEFDEGVVVSYDEYGEDAPLVYADLEALVNEHLPEALF